MESLRQKRNRFARLLAKLIIHMNNAGYEVAIDEVKRTREQAALNTLSIETRKRVAKILADAGYHGLADAIGSSTSRGVLRSTHIHGLAADLQIYRNGVWLNKTEDHAPFGAYWETLAPDCRWGGRFNDGNHYSIEHEGVK